MAKKGILRDFNNIEILPITRGELVLDSSGKVALHSNEFLATYSYPGLMSAEDKVKIDTITGTVSFTDTKVEQINTTTSGNYRLLFSGTADDEDRTEGARKASSLLFNPATGNLTAPTFVGDLTGNAASATKLATARTIWGQSFDGTSDVGGSLTLYKNSSDYTANWARHINVRNSANTILSTFGFYGIGDTLLYTYIGSSYESPQVCIRPSGNVLIGTTTDNGAKLQVAGNVSATSFIGNLDGTYINKLTGYTKATTISALVETDTLNSALGKLELKADVVYDLVKGAYDGDGTIENLAEILKVLEGISDTETIQAIVGKYLPLTGGTISKASNEPLLINNTTAGGGCYLDFLVERTVKAFVGYSSQDMVFMQLSGGSYLAVKRDGAYYGNNPLLHSGNVGEYNAGSADVIAKTYEGSINYAYNDNKVRLIKDTSVDWETNGYPNRYVGGLSAISNYCGWQMVTYGGTSNNNPYFRKVIDNHTWSAWKTLAFTDQVLLLDGSNAMTDVLFLNFSNPRIAFKSGSTTYGSFGYFSDGLKWYSSAENAYHTIAFTDSNVASATKASQDSDGNQINLTYLKKSELANQELSSNLITITKSLTVTADWMDTGISSTNIPTTGTYIVQVSVHNSTDGIWYCYWSGVMSWYASSTNDTDTDEIILHRAGHAYGNTIYLRTVMQSNSVLKLQIAANKTLSTAATYTFKFKRVI